MCTCVCLLVCFPIGRRQEKAGEGRGKGAPDSAANSKGPANCSQQRTGFHSCSRDKLKVPGLYFASQTLSEQRRVINYAKKKKTSLEDSMYRPLFSQWVEMAGGDFAELGEVTVKTWEG